MLGVPFPLHNDSLGIKEKVVVAHGWASKPSGGHIKHPSMARIDLRIVAQITT